MKVTQVAIRPTEASEAAGRPSLTPELLAASGARYSRNNEGLEAILSKIDPTNLDRSVESIFRMIDYGHQSIADMVPVAMFVDGISIWLAYLIWACCPTAGGQESSTRYIRLSLDGLIPSERLGIPAAETGPWARLMEEAFDTYHEAVTIWEEIAAADPSLMRIPAALLDDPSDAAVRKVARMRRNYAFDRARYFLPVAAETNVMLLMSARGWVQLCQNLLSHPLPEAREVGTAIHEELKFAAPRLLKHAEAKPSIVQGLQQEFDQIRDMAAREVPEHLSPSSTSSEKPPTAELSVMSPDGVSGPDLAVDLRFHDNRYAWIGNSLRRTVVRFGWQAVALAEIRDLNRHRTGSKHCPLVPQGFYAALDQIPAASPRQSDSVRRLTELASLGRRASFEAHQRLAAGTATHGYWTLLGTQFPFEHVTTADKFLYEAELRTGLGAHYRYARHLHDALELWYARYPETRGLILEGTAEPE